MTEGGIPPQVVDEWVKFFETEASRPVGRAVYPDVFANGWLFPLQRMRETERMIRIFRQRAEIPRVVMEIGADKGGSFYHWVKQPYVKKAIAIEIRGVPWGDVFRQQFPCTEFLFLAQSSYAPSTVRQVQDFLGDDRLGSLFIDGDKSAFDRDFAAYQDLVATGGVVFLHDINDAGNGVSNPRQTFEKASMAGYGTEEILDTSEYDLIERRMAQGLPPANSYEQWFRIWQRRSCGVGVVYL